MVRLLSCKLEEVIPIARDHDQVVLESVLENCVVRGLARKHFAHATDPMPKMLEEVTQLVGDIIVQEEVHGSPGDICRATRTSISPRWSS